MTDLLVTADLVMPAELLATADGGALAGALAGAASGLAVLLLRRQGRRDTARLAALARCWGGTLRRGALHAGRHGVPVRLRLLAAADAPRFVASVVCRPTGRLRCTRAGRIDRLGRRLPRWPFSTGDLHFDRAVTVQTRDIGTSRRLLRRRDVRDTVRALLARGVSAVHVDRDRVKAIGPRRLLGRALDEAALDAIYAQLATVARAVDAVTPDDTAPVAPRRDTAQVLCWVGLGLITAWAVTAGIAADGHPSVLEPGLLAAGASIASLPLLAAALAGLVVAAARRTAPQRMLPPLLLGAVLAVPLATVTTAFLLNVALDDGAVTLRPVAVVATETVARTHGAAGVRLVVDWRGERHRVPVGADSVPHDPPRVFARLRPGALGVPWHDGWHVEEVATRRPRDG